MSGNVVIGGLDLPADDRCRAMYVLAARWNSDLRFFEDELRFLRKLLDNYYLWLTDDGNISRAGKVSVTIGRACRQCALIGKNVAVHLHRLAAAMASEDIQCRGNHLVFHSELESAMADFCKAFRDVRTQVFALTSHVLELEERASMSEVLPDGQ